MGFPLMVRAIRLSLEAIDPRLEAAARTLGARPIGVFFSVTLPLTSSGILAGVILAFARSLGADMTVDYSVEPLKETLKELTGGKGVDVVYDPVGGELSEQAIRATAWEGRFLVIGFAAGDIPKIPLNIVMLKGCDIRGVFWGAALDRDPEGHRRNMKELLSWVSEGKLKPHIHGVYKLEETATTLEEIAARRVQGKVIVTP